MYTEQWADMQHSSIHTKKDIKIQMILFKLFKMLLLMR